MWILAAGTVIHHGTHWKGHQGLLQVEGDLEAKLETVPTPAPLRPLQALLRHTRRDPGSNSSLTKGYPPGLLLSTGDSHRN